MMKKITYTCLVLLASVRICIAQTSIVAAEYFFDTDPGFGSATPLAINAADTVTANLSIPVPPLSNGMHVFCMRTKDNLGNWGLTTSSLVMIGPRPSLLQKAEYFFDADPGFGNGSPIIIPNNDSLVSNLSLATPFLSNGSHLISMRVQDNSGTWGQPATIMVTSEPKSSALVKGEYYLDTDPGIGNATAFNFSAVDTFSNQASLTLPAATLGLHRFCFRMKDNAGNWGFQTCTQLQIVPNNQGCTDVEYYFDSDPGVGNGIQLNLNLMQDTINLQNMNIPVPMATSVGTHYLFIRSRTNGIVYSHASIDTFDVTFNPVPVNLLNFTVKKFNQQAMLAWATSQEMNNHGFEIQRSIDAVNFSVIGFVNGNGNTAQTSNYRFTDPSPVAGKNFYRLRQIDFDSRFKLSEIRRLDFGNDNRPLVYPNPFSNLIQVLNVPDRTAYNILNEVGQVVMQGKLSGNIINSSSLAKGVYTLKLGDGISQHLIKLIKN